MGNVAAVQGLPSEVLTPQEVAAWLKVTPRQLNTMGVPSLFFGHKTRRYWGPDVLAWVQAQRRPVRRAA